MKRYPIDWKTILLNDNTPHIDSQIQRNPYQKPRCLFNFFFCRNWQANLKIHMKVQGTQNSQNNLKKEKRSWRTRNSQFLNFIQRYSNPNCDTGIRTDIKINWFWIEKDQLIVNTIQWGKNSLSVLYWDNWIYTCKNSWTPSLHHT